jgi:CHAD domain-containing protein
MRKFARKRTIARLKTLDGALRLAARNPKDADAVHDLRVAIRRFVQCLKVFPQFFDARAARKVRRRLGKLMDFCAAVRNCDIAMELLRETGIEDASLTESLMAGRATAERTLAGNLKRWRRRSIRKTWPARLETAPRRGLWALDSPPLDAARRVLPALAARLFTAGNAAASPEASREAMHRFRIHAKQFRYTLELFEPMYGREMEVRLSELRALQDKLGRINDCVTTQALVKDHVRAVAALTRLAERRETEFRACWTRTFDPTAKRRWKAWLSGTHAAELEKKEPHADLHSQARRSRVA